MGDDSIPVKYLQLGPLHGRGGVLTLFLVIHGIRYELTEYSFAEWGANKDTISPVAENPTRHLPTVIIDGKVLTQAKALMKYIAALKSITPADPFAVYVQDAIGDEYESLRGAWAPVFSADEATKEVFKLGDLRTRLTCIENLYGLYKTEDVFLSLGKDGKPLWGDAAMFCMIDDLMHTALLTKEELSAYPRLEKLFSAVEAIPAAKEHLDAKRA